MFLREKVEKLKKKEHFKKSFSQHRNVDYWESVYGRKDFWGVCYRKRMCQALSWLDNSNLLPNSRILDVGCGAGVMTREVANRGYEVFGMDYSHNMIRRAKAICSVDMKFKTNFLEGDIESLPFKDSVFDTVLCLGVVTYLKSEGKALHEISRVLKPGGILILSILNKASLAKSLDISLILRRRIKKIVSNITPSWRNKRGIRESYSGIRSYFIPRLRNSLRIAGFKELDRMAVQYGPLTFFGRKIFSDGTNINITKFIEKFSNMPFVRSFGDMCLFKLTKVG